MQHNRFPLGKQQLYSSLAAVSVMLTTWPIVTQSQLCNQGPGGYGCWGIRGDGCCGIWVMVLGIITSGMVVHNTSMSSSVQDLQFATHLPGVPQEWLCTIEVEACLAQCKSCERQRAGAFWQYTLLASRTKKASSCGQAVWDQTRWQI